MKKWTRIAIVGLCAFFAFVVALYAIAFVAFPGVIVSPPPLAESFRARPWGIIPHALFGAIALSVGWTQFSRRIRTRRPRVHRTLGKIYVVAAMLSGAAGLYMAFYAFGGPIARFGFGGLAVALLSTTSIGLAKIRSRDITAHRQWMLRSYALIFAAVTLRLEAPFLAASISDFASAYRVIAWLSWVPNLIAAEAYVRITSGAGSSLSQAVPAEA